MRTPEHTVTGLLPGLNLRPRHILLAGHQQTRGP